MKFIILIGFLIGFYSYFPTIIGKIRWKRGFSPSRDKEIMLTFDDGPDPVYTRELLEFLSRENIRASFFLVTDFAIENKDLVARMEREGHTIGVHSSNHRPIFYRGYLYTKNDFEKSLDDMKTLGLDIKYYRPPWGQVNLFSYLILKKYNVKKILWNVMAEDWSRKLTSYDIENRLLERIKTGSIVCLHDARGEEGAPRRTIEALERIIPKLKEEGYSFITVGDYYG